MEASAETVIIRGRRAEGKLVEEEGVAGGLRRHQAGDQGASRRARPGASGATATVPGGRSWREDLTTRAAPVIGSTAPPTLVG